jgi:hypothetical protein
MNEPYALVGEVLTPAGPTRVAVVIRDGKIDAVLREPQSGDLPSKYRNFAGLLCPSFVDLQINGAFGADIGPDLDAIRTLVAKLPATGVTSFLPTLISSPPERYEEFFTALEEGTTQEGARVLGAHLEGPFLAPERKGGARPRQLATCGLGFPPRASSFGEGEAHDPGARASELSGGDRASAGGGRRRQRRTHGGYLRTGHARRRRGPSPGHSFV